MTRAERYKRNYALVRNKYNNASLAKKAQTWSDERLYETLGIQVTQKTPKLKSMSKNTRYYEKKLDNFQTARKKGLSVKQANRLSYRNRFQKWLSVQDEYEQLKNSTDNSYEAREKRISAWKRWSKHEHGIFPIQVELEAQELNEKQSFDVRAQYGYAFKYYEFVEGSSRIASEIVKADKFAVSKYENTRRVIEVV